MTHGITYQTRKAAKGVGRLNPYRVADARGGDVHFLPGQVSVKVVKGGLDVPDEEADDVAVIASAAVEVRLELS